jgi:hypothetical protein
LVLLCFHKIPTILKLLNHKLSDCGDCGECFPALYTFFNTS